VCHLVDALAAQFGAGRVGIGGVSLGGFITYAAVVREPRLLAATPLLGSPEWKLLHPDSPHLHVERFFPAALFSQTAAEDEVVPPGPVRDLHARLGPFYARRPARLRYREFAGAGHIMPAEAWGEACRGAADWLAHFLGQERHLA
jgi:uncharacterized protein